jgi:hypothetical protein
MPGGGLFSLVAYGSQNVLLSGNPDFTYFYKTYKKYTHYAEESQTFVMDGPQELSYDQTVQVRFKVQRTADLVRDIYFVCDLPDIYCKFVDLPVITTIPQRVSQYNFSWVNFIGCHLIQSIGFYIGGQKIQEFDGTYLITKAQCDLDANAYQKWQRLVGNVPELYDPANGIYGGGSTGKGYPLVYNNNGPSGSTTVPTNVNRPSIAGRQLQVPIPFWFAESTFGALPLIALQLHECEIRITLRPINQLYRILDENGYQVAPGYQYHASPVSLQPQNVYYTSSSDISDVTINNFLTDVGVQKPIINTFQLRPRIQLTYVYVTEEEQKEFSASPLQYLARQVIRYDFDALTTRQLVLLDTHNPVERMMIVSRRSDSLLYRNQVDNFTNWVDPTRPPFLASDGGWNTTVNLLSSTGQFIVNGQRSILRGLTMICDGTLLQEEKPIEYYTQVIPWKYMTGNPSPDLVIYPFGLTSPTAQPNGSINCSRIRKVQLDLDVYPIPVSSFYNYQVSVYVESLNWVAIASGMGGLKYAL